MSFCCRFFACNYYAGLNLLTDVQSCQLTLLSDTEIITRFIIKPILQKNTDTVGMISSKAYVRVIVINREYYDDDCLL